jgi:serpin B
MLNEQVAGNLVQDNTTFAIKLYNSLVESGDNIFLSNYSIITSLSMIYASARDETAQQMARALELSTPPDQLHPAFGYYIQHLKTIQEKPGLTLLPAIALWPQIRTPFLASFTRLVRETYGATFTPIDYIRPEKAREVINTWVAENTAGKIQELIPLGVLNDLVRMVVVNAVYFKSDWLSGFDPNATRAVLFHINEKEHYDVPMMRQVAQGLYYEDDELQWLELPYAGSDVSMILLLPRGMAGITDLENSLSADRLLAWERAAQKRSVEINLPRFELTSSYQLCPALRGLGMPVAFTPMADFSGMNGFQWHYISACFHRAMIQVDEGGAEVGPAPQIPGSSELPVFMADHPFLFLIRENRFQSTLFIGRLNRP